MRQRTTRHMLRKSVKGHQSSQLRLGKDCPWATIRKNRTISGRIEPKQPHAKQEVFVIYGRSKSPRLASNRESRTCKKAPVPPARETVWKEKLFREERQLYSGTSQTLLASWHRLAA